MAAVLKINLIQIAFELPNNASGEDLLSVVGHKVPGTRNKRSMNLGILIGDSGRYGN